MDLLGHHRLRLYHPLHAAFSRQLSHIPAGLFATLRPKYMPATSFHVPLELKQVLVKMLDRLLPDCRTLFARGFPVRKTRHPDGEPRLVLIHVLADDLPMREVCRL